MNERDKMIFQSQMEFQENQDLKKSKSARKFPEIRVINSIDKSGEN